MNCCMTVVCRTTMKHGACARRTTVMVAIWSRSVAKTIARPIHVQAVQCAWTRLKASNACVRHGKKRVLIVSLGFSVALLQWVLLNIKKISTEAPSNCPCINGGICVRLPSGILGCSCAYGFSGERCEQSKFSRAIHLFLFMFPCKAKNPKIGYKIINFRPRD